MKNIFFIFLPNIFYLGGIKDEIEIPDVWRYDSYNWLKQTDLYKPRSKHRTIRINNNYIGHVGDYGNSSNRY